MLLSRVLDKYVVINPVLPSCAFLSFFFVVIENKVAIIYHTAFVSEVGRLHLKELPDDFLIPASNMKKEVVLYSSSTWFTGVKDVCTNSALPYPPLVHLQLFLPSIQYLRTSSHGLDTEVSMKQKTECLTVRHT